MTTDIVVRIPPDVIEFENLDVLASALALFTGERVVACEILEIRTASPRAAAAVKALLNGTAEEPASVSVETAQAIADQWTQADDLNAGGTMPKKKRKDAGKPHAKAGSTKETPAGAEREYRSWDVIIDGKIVEKITKTEKESRLSRGAFLEATKLHHPRSGTWWVVGDLGHPQTLRAVNGQAQAVPA